MYKVCFSYEQNTQKIYVLLILEICYLKKKIITYLFIEWENLVSTTIY